MRYVLDKEVVARKDLLYGELMDGWSLFLLYEQLETAYAPLILSYFPY